MLDRVPDITRETVAFKDTLLGFELHAVQKLHARQLIKVDGAPIFERPMLTKVNFQKSPAYLEWRRLVEETKNSMSSQPGQRQVAQEGCKRVEAQKPKGSEEPDEGGRLRKVSIMVNKSILLWNNNKYGTIIIIEIKSDDNSSSS